MTKAVFFVFLQFLREIKNDLLLSIMLPLPLLLACLLRFLVPRAETLLCSYFNSPAILTQYIGLIDLLMLAVPSMIISYLSVMVILEEADEGTARFLCVTPLGKMGYLLARLGMSNLAAVIYSGMIGLFFLFQPLPLEILLAYSLIYGLNGIMISMFVTTFSANKVEGMALLKLSSLFFLGLAVPEVMAGRLQYIFGFLPTYWLAAFDREPQVYKLAAAVLSAGVWIFLFIRKFVRRLL